MVFRLLSLALMAAFFVEVLMTSTFTEAILLLVEVMVPPMLKILPAVWVLGAVRPLKLMFVSTFFHLAYSVIFLLT